MLLIKYFDKHEFELFRFTVTYILNDQLAMLNNENNAQLASYLYYLSRDENTFATLKEFIVLLYEKISIQNYRQFINDPQNSAKVMVTDYKPSIIASQLVQNNLHQSYMNEPNFELSGNFPESKWGEADSTSEATDWQHDNIDGKR